MSGGAAQRRRRRLWPVLALLAVLACLAGLAFAVFAGRVVVPAASARLYPLKFEAEIATAAGRYDLDPYLVAAVARAESGFNPRAESRAGARGLMQLMPGTVEFVLGLDGYQGSDKPTLTDPQDSLELGACYLAYLLRRFGGDETAALAAYNAGPTPVGRWIEAGGGGSLAPDDIAYPETREYVKRVAHFRDLFERVHPEAF